MFRFEIVKTDPITKARAGLLHTPHGTVETPVFMPVGTLGSVKGMTQQMLEDLGARIILGNTYHLYIRPGHELIRNLGGLHKFMSWDRAILTDSGGFQVFSLSKLRKIEEQGVTFRSHLDGSQHFFSPESTVEIQNALGSDIQMQLDECTPYPVSHETARASMQLSARWAERAKQEWLKTRDNPSTLFPIVQGSMFPDLRQESANRLVDLDLPGYAIGGLSVGEPRPLTFDMVAATEPHLPTEKPRYVMGVGMPEEIPEYVALGVDMMDCVLPTRNARNGMLFTSHGRMHIGNARYATDPLPPDEKCSCMVCRRYSRAYLRHLYQTGELLASILNTVHNLHFYLDRMRQIRQAIVVEDFSSYLQVNRQAMQDTAADTEV
jgi:queuine tRNA-ribosyltransferase